MQLFTRAAERAAAVMAAMAVDQLHAPTPCTEWSVQQLVDHMVGSTDYLLGALLGGEPDPRSGAGVEDYRAGVVRVLDELDRPGALERTCMSPLGFEWTIEQATAGTFMDNLVHTWDLATATGQDPGSDGELVEACVAMFLPDMPERGRAAGIVGPEVAVPAGASAQDRLLGAMGRRP
ncbi:TIGR03086 family metal-binding protein [Pseudonocardia humida]|uniref:TIGR03086 family protein n=1 Tax=Pseudonocardia humida TaxID=2800819 RepID=A0ABT1A9P0_9PSEU|nr:TIGR03086 family metal-binding protein [Pseudonocardia humida]MCO1659728.1 TIGR03086 family protein [Pseudonocardia humida]